MVLRRIFKLLLFWIRFIWHTFQMAGDHTSGLLQLDPAHHFRDDRLGWFFNQLESLWCRFKKEQQIPGFEWPLRSTGPGAARESWYHPDDLARFPAFGCPGRID